MPALETVDLLGVDVMTADEVVHGQGCPPGGESYNEDQLRTIAAASNEYVERVRPFVKIGHGKEQKLAKASGLYDEAENPATGWLSNFRVETGKLVADVMRVPKKLARLQETGAFRTRSAELKLYEGKPVVSALALLGAKAPAFKTLDDIYALYNETDDGEPSPVEHLYLEDEPADGEIMFAAGDVVWDPELAASDIMQDVTTALNPGPTPGMEVTQRYWCSDVVIQGGGGSALVNDYSLNDSSLAWIVPFTLDATNEPVPAPSTEWTLAQQAWIARTEDAAATYSEHVTRQLETEPAGSVDTKERAMPETNATTTTDEQSAPDAEALKAFAAAVGLPETATADEITAKAAELRAAAEKKADPVVEEGVRQMSEEEYETLARRAERGDRAFEALRTERRNTAVDGAIKDGRINPSDRDKWIKRFDEQGEFAAEVLSEMKPDPAFQSRNVVGSDESDDRFFADSDQTEAGYREYCELNGIAYIPAVRSKREEATA